MKFSKILAESLRQQEHKQLLLWMLLDKPSTQKLEKCLCLKHINFTKGVHVVKKKILLTQDNCEAELQILLL